MASGPNEPATTALQQEKRTAAPTPPTKISEITFDTSWEGFVQIPELDFFGQYSRSPNRRYTLAWKDGNNQNTHSGARADGPRRALLFQGRRLILQTGAERPHEGKVTDDGTHVLNDWGFRTELFGTFLAYRADGTCLVAQDYEATVAEASSFQPR